MRSHIQMPKLVLKNFTDRYNYLHYYDYEKNIIGRNSPKSFYVQSDYFSQDVEEFLSDEVESKLGGLIKFLKETTFKEGTQIKADYEDISRNYVLSLITRSPAFLKQINKSSVIFQFCSSQSQHDYAAVEGYDLAKEQGLFNKFSMAFLLNATLEEFVLPTGGIIQIGNQLICPVLPTKAIILKCSEIINNELHVNVYVEEDKSKIRMINIEAFRQEKNRDGKYVVSSSERLLQSIKEELLMSDKTNS